MYEFVGFIHRKGTSSKTGNPYEFFSCSFLFPYNESRSDCGGSEAVNINLSPDVFYKSDLAGNIGKKCKICFNRRGYAESVEVV